MPQIFTLVFWQYLQQINNPLAISWLIFKSGLWLVLIPIVVVALWRQWLYSVRKNYLKELPYLTLAIDIPGDNLQSPKAVENIFAQIAATPQHFNLTEKYWQGKTAAPISFELISDRGYVQYVVYAPKILRRLAESAIYAQYPDAVIQPTEDYAKKIKIEDLTEGKIDVWGTQFKLAAPYHFPLRTYPFFEHQLTQKFNDPLSSVFEMMSHLNQGEQFWLQITVTPSKDDNWKQRGIREIRKAVGDDKELTKSKNLLDKGFSGLMRGAGGLVDAFGDNLLNSSSATPSKKDKKQSLPKITTMIPPEQELIVKSVRDKISRLGLACKIRALYLAPKNIFNKEKIAGNFLGVLNQLANPQMNSLISDPDDITETFGLFSKQRLARRQRKLYYKMRYRAIKPHKPGFILNVEELATLWHFPDQDLIAKGSLVKKVLSKKVSAKLVLPNDENHESLPADEVGEPGPSEINLFAQTNYRGQNKKFGIKTEDRRRHMYVIGRTGMGKTTLLENMIYQDIAAGRGLAVIDPHGDLTETILDLVPSSRVNDVIYFNPADIEHPIAFNIIEPEEANSRYLVGSALVGIFKKIWADSWGPRLEYILRNTLLALLETQGNTILGVNRLFIDKAYRSKIIAGVHDPVVKNFWEKEYTKYSQNFQTEAISPIQNKIGQFISIPIIRNIIGQVRSKINFREIMDQQKILLVNLAKGLIGEDVSALLGAAMVSKLQIAAMMRANMPENQRTDFYLYIDEFQNFSTDAFCNILSEARKYRLNLIIAHQYIEQLLETVAAAVFGNVGSMVCFNIGAEDAKVLEAEFEPEFLIADLVNLGKYEIALRLMIDGIMSRPFSANTLPPLGGREVTNRDKIIRISRERYSVSRQIIEEKLIKWLR